jgi:hypothetical protein
MKGGTVIRSSQRAATGRRRGQLPRNSPGICGVAGKARGIVGVVDQRKEKKRKKKKRKSERPSGVWWGGRSR